MLEISKIKRVMPLLLAFFIAVSAAAQTVTINGGTVIATGGSGATGIGGAGTGTFTLNGNGVVFSSGILATQTLTNGILFNNATVGTFYGTSVTPTDPVTIPAGHSLTVPNGKTLTIQAGITLTNNGTVTPANGSIVAISGTVSGNKIVGANANTPTENSKIGTSITVNAANLLATTGQTAEYAISTTNSVSGLTWGDDTTFSSLSRGTPYYIFARSKENTNFGAGTASAALQVTIPKLDQSITWTQTLSATYGDAPVTLNATASSGLTVSYISENTNVATINGNMLTIVGAGTAVIKAQEAGDATYNAATDVPQTLTVSPKALTVTGLTISDKKYDGNTTASLGNRGILNGLVNGDEVSIDSANVVANFNTKNVVASPYTQPVTISALPLTGADAANYTIAPPAGLTAALGPRNSTIVDITFNNKVYDGSTTATVSAPGTLCPDAIGNDVVSLDPTRFVASFSDKNVGTDKAVTINSWLLIGADAANYVITRPAGLTADITPKAITVTDLTISYKRYDGNTTASLGNRGTLNGVVNGDTVSIDSAAVVANFSNKNAAQNKPVTISALPLIGAHAANYILTIPTGLTADLSPRNTVILNMEVNNKTYDGTTAATVSAPGTLYPPAIGSDVVSLDPTGFIANFSDKNVGTVKTVTLASWLLTGADAANYVITPPAGLRANITPKAVTVTAEPKIRTYGDADPELTYNVSPALVAGDAFSGGLSRNTGDNVGKYEIQQGTLSNSNYAITYVKDSLTITPKAVTITAEAKTKTYGDTDPTFTYTINPALVAGDAFSGGLSRVAGDNVGKYEILQGGLAINDGNSGNNYTLTYVKDSLTITKKDLTVAGMAIANKIYDGNTTATISNTGTLNGIINADEVNIDSAGVIANFDNKNVGTAKPIIVSDVPLTGAHAANYRSQPSGLTANITPLAVTVTAEPKTKTYGETDPTFTYTVNPTLVAGDAFSGGLSRNAGNNVGKYEILQGNLANANYAITYVKDSLTITKAMLIVTAQSDTVDVGFNPAGYTGSYNIEGFVNSETEAVLTANPVVSIAPDITSATPVGVYAGKILVDGAQTQNYDFTYQNGTLTIKAKTGILTPKQEKAMLKMYPNPVTNGQLTINNENLIINNGTNIEFFDLNGKLAGTFTLTGEKTDINIGHLPTGTYFVKVGNAVTTIVVVNN